MCASEPARFGKQAQVFHRMGTKDDPHRSAGFMKVDVNNTWKTEGSQVPQGLADDGPGAPTFPNKALLKSAKDI